MDVEENIDTPSSKKRKISDNKNEESPKTKKAKSYSVKEFRKKLNSDNKLIALQEFQQKLNDPNHDYVFDYLENGGNVLELLQILENDSTIPPSIVFKLITLILLKINANYSQFYNSSYEACRYLINNYIPVIHKMIGLSSSKEERKTCLKLLTAMVAFSSNLAKDILVNVKFHTPNIELLTKHTEDKDNVRDNFIHFVTGFLIDSDFHILQIFLQRSSLFTSIISGLQYDRADTVCLIIAAMKNYILQNSAVMKTTKMHVFNTAIVRDIVNLYNWKGPGGFKALKNDKIVVEVDKVEKSKVNECVHDFLLVLCTNLKYGVIFKDPLVGLGRKNQNGLMYTVVNSLDRPWEHSYASELVIKIAQACPDLCQNIWTILKPFLEPRLTEKWLKAVEFIKSLLDVLDPSCIEYCVTELTPQQLAQIIEILVSPAPILKLLLSGDAVNKDLQLKKHVYDIMSAMLKRIDTYLQAMKSKFSPNDCKITATILSNFIQKHYPFSEKLFSDWRDFKPVDNEQKFDFLEVVLDILKSYQNLAPQMLFKFTSFNFAFDDFFVESIENDRHEILQIKAIDIFLDIDNSYFLPKSDIFENVTSLLLKMYHKHKSEDIQIVLYKILKNTDIFDGCLYEIQVWCNGIFNFDNISESFIETFVNTLKDVSANILVYQKELSLVSVQENTSLFNFNEDLEDMTYQIKHSHFSILTAGFLKHLQQTNLSKTLKKYLEFVLINIFHSQTIPNKYLSVVQMYHSTVPDHVLKYIQDWTEGNCEPLIKTKGSLGVFKKFSESFLSSTIENEFFDNSEYPGFYVDLLKAATFYFTNLTSFSVVTENHSKNWIFCIEQVHNSNFFNASCFEVVLGNPNLAIHFNIKSATKDTATGICTRAIHKVVQTFRDLSLDVEEYVGVYSQSIFNSIIKGLKKPKKFRLSENVGEYLKVFPLSYEYCISLLERTLDVLENCDISVSEILSYALSRTAELSRSNELLKPLDQTTILNISKYIIELIKLGHNCFNLSKALKCYLEVFPYSIDHIDQTLFPALLEIKEYNKENTDLIVFLLERNLTLSKHIETNIVAVAEKKGLILPLTHVLVNSKNNEGILKIIYENLEGSLLKALQKPQKVGQHFLKDYNIAVLIESFMPVEKCSQFTDKVHRFEVTEVFHLKFLEAVFSKVLNTKELNEKQAGNVILTFIHLIMFLFKKKSSSEDSTVKISESVNIFNRVLEKLSKHSYNNLKSVSSHESFKTFCKYALKFGVSGQHILLATLCMSLNILKTSIEKEEVAELLEMLLSHSEFLNVVLSEHTDSKLEILKLLLIISENWQELIEKSHVAIVLSAYRGLVTRCDRVILKLLKLYESKPDQSHFYDFKPFLWGRSAATHYSVRTSIESSLTRQPKINNVLSVLKEELVNNTITNYSLNDNLHDDDTEVTDSRCYDLKFILPLFSHILAPEQQVKTYVFTRSGALSLTVVGLSSRDKQVRQAACHVLSRFYFHLEARQTGKDNPLWIRFVEALCKGTAVLPDFKLNNFSAIFFARMSLILTNPTHPMYSPLCSYLSAKQVLDLSTVPEIYTLLFSSDVNFKEHRSFILEVLRDGLRTERDFLDLLKSMGLKMLLELSSSCLADTQCKLLISEVLYSACKVPLAVKMLCENYSLLVQLYNVVWSVLSDKKGTNMISKVLKIFLEIVKVRQDEYTNSQVSNLFLNIAGSDMFASFKDEDLTYFYEVFYRTFLNVPGLIRDKDKVLDIVLEKSDDKFSKYLRKYGCNYVQDISPELQVQDKYFYLRLLVFNMMK
ncbi:uncharacterized protein LOC115884273 [Sitophilus oryzae]|uniref:Uncharacterized protein LOC115884273 n=1 Tax=Sitophilus oryzae TaxID=7048 RepID=A0A6J2Y601_SITOR|nr:uncharacterized protein LOC115884273 [Sitophilus oryzae]